MHARGFGSIPPCHCRWPPDRSRPQRRRRTAARSTRNPSEIPRIVYRSVVRIVVGAAQGKLVETDLSEQHHASCFQPADDGGVVFWHEVSQDFGTGGSADALRVVQVFVCDGDSMQGATVGVLVSLSVQL